MLENHILAQFGSVWEVSVLLDVRHYPKLQSSALSRKTNDANLENVKKHNFRPNFFPRELELF